MTRFFEKGQGVQPALGDEAHIVASAAEIRAEQGETEPTPDPASGWEKFKGRLGQILNIRTTGEASRDDHHYL